MSDTFLTFLCIIFFSWVYFLIYGPYMLAIVFILGEVTRSNPLQLIYIFFSLFFLVGLLINITYRIKGRNHFAMWRTLTSAKLIWNINSLIQQIKNCWSQYIFIFLISSTIIAIFLYGESLIHRISIASDRYLQPLTNIYSSIGQIILPFIAVLGFFFFISIVSELVNSINSNGNLHDKKYLQNINLIFLVSPVIFLILVGIFIPNQVQIILSNIFGQISAISRFIFTNIEIIFLVMILILIIQWINKRRYITKIDEFIVIQDDKKLDFCDIDDGLKNEIGRIKKLYLDIGAFRDIESIAQGDFRMFRMTDDPIVSSLSSITGTVKLGSTLSIPVTIFTSLTNSIICAPRISGVLTKQGTSWQMYSSYQDRWKSYTWRVTDEDIKKITDVCTQNKPEPQAQQQPATPLEQSTGKLFFSVYLNSHPISLELPVNFQLKKGSLSSDPPNQSDNTKTETDKKDKATDTKPVSNTLTSEDHSKIVETLTAKIIIDLSDPGTPRWEAYIFYNRGLKSYRQALREGNSKKIKDTHLKEAFSNFIKAVTFDDSYAVAYYGMGLILHEYSSDTYYPLISYLFKKSILLNPGLWQAKYAKMIIDIKKHLRSPFQRQDDFKFNDLIDYISDIREFFTFLKTETNQNSDISCSITFEDLNKVFGDILQYSCKLELDDILDVDKKYFMRNILEFNFPLKPYYEDIQKVPDLDEIIKDCNNLIKNNPDYPAFYYWRGIAQCQKSVENMSYDENYGLQSVNSFQKAIALHKKQYILSGMNEDLYFDIQDNNLMYRSCIQDTYLHLTVSEYIQKNGGNYWIKETDYFSEIEKLSSYINAGLIMPEYSSEELRTKVNMIFKKFSKQ